MSIATVEKSLEVFQDLKLHGPAERRLTLRQTLVEGAIPPWRHAGDAEKKLSIHTRGDSDVLVFQREGGDGLAAAKLFLFASPEGYEVGNIVPSQESALDYSEYNSVLQDFIRRIAAPAAQRTGFTVETTAERQSLDEWLTPQSAEALRRFSEAANKSTGSAHPLDQKRWFRFLLQVHSDTRQLGTSQLARWLTEVEGWSDEKAHELVIEYEFALALLNEYDLRPN